MKLSRLASSLLLMILSVSIDASPAGADSHVEDRSPPTFQGASFDRRSTTAKVGDIVSLIVRAYDDLSGVASIKVYISGDRLVPAQVGSGKRRFLRPVMLTPLDRRSDGTYVKSLQLDGSWPSGPLDITEVEITDGIGWMTSVSKEWLAPSFPNGASATVLTFLNPQQVLVRPRFASVEVDKAFARAGEEIRLKMRLPGRNDLREASLGLARTPDQYGAWVFRPTFSLKDGTLRRTPQAGDGAYEVQYRIPKFIGSGTYRVWFLDVEDTSGNRAHLSARPDVAGRGLTYGYDESGIGSIDAFSDTKIPVVSFDVLGSTPDETSPTIVSANFESPVVSPGDSVRLRLTVIENGSGLDLKRLRDDSLLSSTTLRYVAPDPRNAHAYSRSHPVIAAKRLIRDPKRANGYVMEFDVPDHAVRGMYKLPALVLWDKAGNRTYVSEFSQGPAFSLRGLTLTVK